MRTTSKVFISHSSTDKEYGQALVNLLRSLGLKREQIIFTSNHNYGIPLNEDIFVYLKSQIENNIYMIYLLSDNYYNSVACLNEMGAAWIIQNEYLTIFTPNFDFQNPQFNGGCINPRKIGFAIDDKIRVVEFKNIILNKFNLDIDEYDWNEALEKHIQEINKIKSVRDKDTSFSRKSKNDYGNYSYVSKMKTSREILSCENRIRKEATKVNAISIFDNEKIEVNNATNAMLITFQILLQGKVELIDKIEKVVGVLASDLENNHGAFRQVVALELDGKKIFLGTSISFIDKTKQTDKLCSSLRLEAGSVKWFYESDIVYTSR